MKGNWRREQLTKSIAELEERIEQRRVFVETLQEASSAVSCAIDAYCEMQGSAVVYDDGTLNSLSAVAGKLCSAGTRATKLVEVNETALKKLQAELSAMPVEDVSPQAC